MFDNIGSKIKTVATTIAILGIIGSIIIGSVMIKEANDSYYPSATETLSGWLVIIVGSLSSWVSSFTLYGFGQLIENTDIISSKYITNASDKTPPSSNGAKKSANLDPCIGTCDLCLKDHVETFACKIVDSTRTQYYYLCADCMKKHNAVPIKK